MKILYSGYRDARHTKYGGYDNIAYHPDSTYLRGEDCLFGFIPVGTRGKRLNLMALYIATMRIAKQFDVVHFFIVDAMLFGKISNKNKLGGCQFVATIHLNAENFSERKLSILSTFDKVVCLSSAQERFLREKGINAFFIPHGFNKATFKSVDMQVDKTKINVFYSGTNYRDFDLFADVAKRMTELNPDMRFHALGQTKAQKEVLAGLANVKAYPHINDDEYYSLLDACDYNFLPLTFATANNALLEAQSLGVVSILPDIDGIVDYASKDYNLFYKNGEGAIQLFKGLKKKDKSAEIMEFSKGFEWNNIYARLDALYEMKY